jgi:hypothetical protein
VILSNSSHEAASTLYVEGNIENVGSANIDGFSVYVTYYNADGEVFAVSSEGSTGLAPNETAPFSVSLSGFNEGGRLEAFDRYEVTAEGYDYSLWSADGQLINPEVVYVLGTPEETIVPVKPEGSSYVIYIIIAVLAIGIVVVALFLRSRKHAVEK